MPARLSRGRERPASSNHEGREGSAFASFTFPSVDSASPMHPDGRLEPPSLFDIFISFKSEDEQHARQVYDLLSAGGLRVFFSRESLPQLGSDEYHAQIDLAIDQTRHMVVVTSNRAHVDAQWVQYEWRLFLGERLAGRKTGNLITVIAGEMGIGDLPISLRNREVVRLTPGDLAKLVDYTRTDVDRAAVAARADPIRVVQKTVPSGGTTLPAMAELLSGDHDRIRLGLGRVSPAERQAYVAELNVKLHSPSPTERRSSLTALFMFGDANLAFSAIAAANDSEASVRRQAVFLIGKARMVKGLEVVSFRMSDGNPDVRAAARDAYQKLTGRRARPE